MSQPRIPEPAASPGPAPQRVPPGSHIRERRLSLGRAQADVARAAGISPAYLNLIEHDRRNLTPAIRARLAEVLDISETELEAGREQAVLSGLRVAAAEAPPDLQPPPEVARIAEFAARLPGWAALLVALSERAAAQSRRLADLSERMTRNPYLLDTLHEVLSATTSLRSTASILVQEPRMEDQWRERFHGNLDQDSRRLAVTAQALVAYLDGFEHDTGLMTPQEEFDDWIAQGRPDGGPVSDAARDLAQRWLAQEARDRQDCPDALLAEMVGGDPDPDPLRLAMQHNLAPDLVLRRLGLTEAASGLMVCDGAGKPIFRRAARGMAARTQGDPCGMLPLFEALGQPGTPVLRVIETETGLRFRALALATRQPAWGAAGPMLSRAVMLLRPVPEAEQDAIPHTPPVPVGPTCRICPRPDCPARQVASILHSG
ncbi:XRE family transcriptional regulator [Paracoccus jeotgali]|uniref:XRE family transcriptional regulator n=1 Tax=Paracoccus jeotgali TaxID=2065379 RepID=A0A2K9MI06_9RHOB|nr:XRE family transcriptional regulator [Paracoccus jeotgali]AUM74656.1 XRE family transcriptional regulator [Paracoccus jeotgali]